MTELSPTRDVKYEKQYLLTFNLIKFVLYQPQSWSSSVVTFSHLTVILLSKLHHKCLITLLSTNKKITETRDLQKIFGMHNNGTVWMTNETITLIKLFRSTQHKSKNINIQFKLDKYSALYWKSCLVIGVGSKKQPNAHSFKEISAFIAIDCDIKTSTIFAYIMLPHQDFSYILAFVYLPILCYKSLHHTKISVIYLYLYQLIVLHLTKLKSCIESCQKIKSYTNLKSNGN